MRLFVRSLAGFCALLLLGGVFFPTKMLAGSVVPMRVQHAPPLSLDPAEPAKPAVLHLKIADSVTDAKGALPGETVSYTLTYSNSGERSAHDVELRVRVPDYAEGSSANAERWSCDGEAAARSWCTVTLDEVIGGDADSIQFSVIVVPDLPHEIVSITFYALLQPAVDDPSVICGDAPCDAVYASIDTPVHATTESALYLPMVQGSAASP